MAKRGRPLKKKSDLYRSRVDLRLLPEEKKQMEKAAKAAKLKLSAWIRDVCLEAANKALG